MKDIGNIPEYRGYTWYKREYCIKKDIKYVGNMIQGIWGTQMIWEDLEDIAHLRWCGEY